MTAVTLTRTRRWLWVAGCTAMLVCGCAGMRVRRDTVDPRGPKHVWDTFVYGLTYSSQPRGIRYYQPAVFLVATVNGDGTVDVRHEILPDLERKISAQPVAVFASVGTLITDGLGGLELSRGMLISTETSADATAVPSAIITQAKDVATALAAAAAKSGAAAAAADRPAPRPAARAVGAVYVFRLIPAGRGSYQLEGGEGFTIRGVAR